MTPELFLLLTPLWLALTAAIVILPIGLHFAKKERAERIARTAAAHPHDQAT